MPATDFELQSQRAFKPRVLLVEDDRSVRESLTLALESENFQVIVSGNGKEALERYFEGYVDLVLVDLDMPVGAGWEIFDQLTAINPYLATILITRRLDQRELTAAVEASVIMEKPMNVSLLVAVMNRLVEERLEERLQRLARLRPILLPAEV